MKRLAFYLGFVPVAAIFLGSGMLSLYGNWTAHQSVPLESVAQVELRGEPMREAKIFASPEDAKRIVTWFNSATAVRNNPDHRGPGCGGPDIVIHLRSGERIGISRHGATLEAQWGERDYWFRQPDLERFIATLRTAGCALPGGARPDPGGPPHGPAPTQPAREHPGVPPAPDPPAETRPDLTRQSPAGSPGTSFGRASSGS